ncbi:MAG: DNA-binding response regulator [Acidobacteria bacterium]|jgi:DNA-binding response OmpR family regulator|nr:DNA-binding response regulator [Acidobacteriota bacterium]
MTAEEQLSENFKRAVRLLVVEDEEKVASALRTGLERDGYEVVVEGTGEDACFRLGKEGFDAVVLDLNLPGWDGLEVLTTMRQQGLDVPVLVLTARDSLDDRVVGLDAGADDYLVKPFAFAELLARIRSVARRGRPAEPEQITVETLSIDHATRRVERAGHTLDLTAKEFDLLHYLALHARQVVSRDTLAREVWRETARSTTLDNVIDVHISRLRRKIDEGQPVKLIQTVRGVGFVLREDAD